MNEKFENGNNSSSENGIDVLAEAALDAGLCVKLPPKDSSAYNRLYAAAKRYSDAVHKDIAGAYSGGLVVQRERREAHHELCKMLFGTSYGDTPPQDIKTAANFAHFLSGRERYVRD